ncbi:MAG: TetR/AcrR family transcriptional regulator [Firmicutes bacterium]|nr:TetR/AcrR family transcriptional regulator [Bacillota bacterium]MBQ9605541.1 TetR/AcrR family transcriptional regulator [Bacillota bacterium]
MKNTKQLILTEAVKLFAKEGYEAVTVEMIAAAVGIKAPSLYKHYKSKRDIFNSIIHEMERRDAESVADTPLPADTMEAVPEQYGDIPFDAFLDFCKKQFAYWTEDEFAADFRRMLTVEQYRSKEMNVLYHQYLGSGPLGYTADILGSQTAALELYAPMQLLYGVYDSADDKSAVKKMFETYIEEIRNKKERQLK